MHTKPPVCTRPTAKGSSRKASKFFWDYQNHILWKLIFSSFITSTRIYECINCKLPTVWPIKNKKGIKKVYEIHHPASVLHSPPKHRTDLLQAMRHMLRHRGSCMSPMQGIQTSKMAVENCCKQQTSVFTSYVILRGITLQTMLWKTTLHYKLECASIFPAQL